MRNRVSALCLCCLLLLSFVGSAAMAAPATSTSEALTSSPESTASFGPLTAQIPFVTQSAAAAVSVPQDLKATYTDTLKDVTLPEGFSWSNPDQSVGNVGSKTFAGTYQASAGSTPVQVEIPLEVVPKDGSLCTISPVENGQRARDIVITDGDVTLVDGVDYTVSSAVDGNESTVTITFEGNYTGTVTRTFAVAGGNSWTTPLSMESWVYGQTAADPVAEAAHGTVSFQYLVDGTWQDTKPDRPGSYEVKATVPAMSGYQALEATVTFYIYTGIAPEVSGLKAVYRNSLSSISLPAGFSWLYPSQKVGNVGPQQHTAVYEPTSNEYKGGTVTLTVQVSPRNGALCTISPITDEYTASHIVITDGTYRLVKGKDYVVKSSVDGPTVTVSIDFLGNYYGTVTRTFQYEMQNSWVEAPSIQSWVAGSTPSVPVAQAKYGTPVFTYLIDGTSQSEQPTKPGTYTLVATVAKGESYSGLETQVPFTIYAAVAPEVSGLKAIYRDTLSGISLPSGFSWLYPSQLVGNAGKQEHAAVYKSTSNEYKGGTVTLTVQVSPRNGALCTISPITDEYTASHIIITDGTYRLVKGKDYVVKNSVDGSTVTVSISFLGNYYGTVTKTFQYELQNSWIEAPSIRSWVAGSTPSVPDAQAKYGTPVFTYLVDGASQREQPAKPGTYTLVATVAKGESYSGLETQVPFTIYEAVAPEVSGLKTVYRDPLSSVTLPDGFSWRDPQTLAGDVGTQSYPAVYQPSSDSSRYMGGTVELSVTVGPKNGELCDISPITDQYDSRNIVITDGDYRLVKGKDYTVFSRITGNVVTVTIRFEGNFYGTVMKSFTLGTENSWVVPLSIKDWVYGHTPSTPVAESKYGKPVFTWIVDGKERSTPPTAAGLYEVRAVVAATIWYPQLEATAEFRIYSAVAPEVSGLEAVYLDKLEEVVLPSGFQWNDPDSFVGNVGVNDFPATYTSTSTDYAGGEEDLAVDVDPRNGDECTISPITNEYQARHIEISFGGYSLVEGKDYTVHGEAEGAAATVDIDFEGNFTGQVEKTFTISQDNAWVVPLSMESWAYGEPAASPMAEAKYGDPVFTYEVNGAWTSDKPRDPGTYTVKAEVAATPQYSALVATATFTIYPAVAPSPEGLTAVYGSLLSSVSLPAGFIWADPDASVGNVGTQQHDAIYTPQTGSTQYKGGTVPLYVEVTPKNGDLCTITVSSSNPGDPTVLDGSTKLVKGTDYEVTVNSATSPETVTITFMHNYYGTVTKTVTPASPSAAPGTSASAAPAPSVSSAPSQSAAPGTSASPAPSVSSAPSQSTVPGASASASPTPATSSAPSQSTVPGASASASPTPAMSSAPSQSTVPGASASAAPAPSASSVPSQSPAPSTSASAAPAPSASSAPSQSTVPGASASASPTSATSSAPSQSAAPSTSASAAPAPSVSSAPSQSTVPGASASASPTSAMSSAPSQSTAPDASASASPTPAVSSEPSASAGLVPTVSPGPAPSSAPSASTPASPVPVGPVVRPQIVVKEGRNLELVDFEDEKVVLGPDLTVTQEGLSVADVLEQLDITGTAAGESGWQLEVVTADRNTELARGTVVTGDYVQLVWLETGAVLDEVAIVIRGDVLGTGTISVAQVVRMAQDINKTRPLSGLYALAGRFNEGSVIDIADLVDEARILIGEPAIA